METRKQSRVLLLIIVALILSGCTNKEGAHTTTITHIAPPPQQVLTVVSRPIPPPAKSQPYDLTADPEKPLLLFRLENGATFHVGEEVPVDFSVHNAKLRSEGGEFRVRYIVDDDDMKWLDTAQPFWLAGWIPGKHTIRVELIGPDGWPYKNGNANIVTREIEVR